MNIIEEAIIKKARFPAGQGSITTEDLYDLPLESKSRPSLSGIAQVVYDELQRAGGTRFLKKSTSKNSILELKLKVLEHVIAYKEDAAEAAEKAAKNRDLKAKLISIKAKEEEDELLNMSKEDREKLLAELS